ncbi:MAG: hypothetical protein WC444_05805 [Candidatus Paceibacterota bacterium]
MSAISTTGKIGEAVMEMLRDGATEISGTMELYSGRIARYKIEIDSNGLSGEDIEVSGKYHPKETEGKQ